MASGHAYRTNRSNTWPHRPGSAERQINPCQRGAVHTWRYRFQRGKAQPDVAELIDLFADFETSLTGRDREPEARAAIAAR